MRAKLLNDVLEDFWHGESQTEAAAVISSDGLLMGARLPESFDEDRLAAISSAMLSLAGRAADEFSRGDIEQVIITGEQGNFLICRACDDAVVVTMTSAQAQLGMVLHECRRLAAEVGQIL